VDEKKGNILETTYLANQVFCAILELA